MTSKHLDTINDRLTALHGHAFFKPHAGALKERLTQQILTAAAGAPAETVHGEPFDLEVTVLVPEGESQPQVNVCMEQLGVEYTAKIAAALLADDALQDLEGYLTRLCEEATPAKSSETGKSLQQRSKHGADHHEKVAASTRLKVSPEWLKRVVPCTEYDYEEIDGKKYIREYYWAKPLIERLFKIKSTKTTPEDLQFVAKECCEGDMEWARDLIARLKSPNRPEPSPKEQSQKAQGRPVQAQPGPSERQRSRSRHKKPPREPGKDGGAKPGAAAEQKGPRP